jgi:hypothetical protein
MSAVGLFDIPPPSGVCCVPGTGLGGACFSRHRRFRYSWWRHWSDRPIIAFVMLNPSIADERRPDRTVDRCLSHARRLGYGTLIVVNISPLVATNRFEMYAAPDAAGEPEKNARHLTLVTQHAHRIIVAYGAAADHKSVRPMRAAAHDILSQRHLYRPLPIDPYHEAFIPELQALRITKDGWPEHPLYVPGNLDPVPYAI